MELANARLKMNKLGSDVPLFGITPAEARVLQEGHGVNVGGPGEAVTIQEIVGKSERSSKDEVARLKHSYGNLRRSKDAKSNIVEELYPGDNPALPQTFKEVGLAPTGVGGGPTTYAPEPEGGEANLQEAPPTASPKQSIRK